MPNRHLKENIFDTKFTLPEDVYIVAPGPLGEIAWLDIPRDAYVIAVNKGLLIQQKPCINWRASIWMSWAKGYKLHKIDWFMQLLAHDTTPRLFGSYPNNAQGLGDTEDCRYTFLYYPSYCNVENAAHGWPSYPPGLMEGVLRCGGTIAGAAIQFAYWFGAARCYLVGVDMFGPRFYDGTMYNKGIESGEPCPRKLKTWRECAWCDRIISDVQARGMDVITLSDTMLQKPRRMV